MREFTNSELEVIRDIYNILAKSDIVGTKYGTQTIEDLAADIFVVMRENKRLAQGREDYVNYQATR